MKGYSEHVDKRDHKQRRCLKMKKKTIWISAAIAVVVAIPGVSALAASVPTATPAATSNVTHTPDAKGFDGRGGHGKGEGAGDRGKGGAHGGLMGGFHEGGLKGTAHNEEYLVLLSEKYAPDQTANIKAAYDQKASLNTQIQALRDANKTTLDQKRADEKAKVEAIRAKVTSGELTKTQADEQIKALRDAGRPAKQAATADEQAQREANKALHDSFDAAVQTVVDGGSSDALTQILPKLVDQLKAENQRTGDRLAKMKTAAVAG
jgi:hypothetical protein